MNKEILNEWMGRALDLAASIESEIPIAALIYSADGELIGHGVNTRMDANNPFGHAEMNAIVMASKHENNWRLDGATLVVTLEPCAMCAGAIAQTRIARVVFGAWDEKAGAVGSVWDLLRDPKSPHQVEVFSGIEKEKCAQLLSTFFEQRRN
jgi:tRNA(adenine34) deaminase